MADKPGWTFLSNHAHVLVCLARQPEARLRDVAVMVGITERTAIGIVNDLEQAGVLVRTKVGRRNSYAIDKGARLRHPMEDDHTVGDLIAAVG